MFRRLIITTAMIAVSTTFVFADDTNPIDEGAFDWSGLYLGGQVGHGRSDFNLYEGPDPAFTFLAGGAPGDFLLSHSPSGGVYGIVAGYNWQVDTIVYGVEASWSSTSIDETVATAAGTSSVAINSILTIGPRIGVAMDNWLFYGEGGYASADIEITAVGAAGTYNSSGNHNGYFFGAGLDWAIDQNWILGVEYNHIVLGDEVQSATVAGVGLLDVLVNDISIDTVMARLAYKF